nr:hypothetical protein [Pseudoxanthomonas sp.]
GAGHYGIFSGRRWRTQVYPQVKAFIAAHAGSNPPVVAATSGAMPARKPAARASVATKATLAKPQRLAKKSTR